MHPPYPPIKPYRSVLLAVDDIHQLYVEESGSIEGIPVLFIHGGPGAGASEQDRCFFNPEKYRIIVFDQRGAGRSIPHAELQNNNTQLLIDDIEVIRQYLGINQWMLFGGSWGSTLSLLYAQKHPEQVIGMILRGVFLCRRQDLRWFYQYGASQVFPDYWQEFIEPISPDKRDNLVQAYYELLTGDNELARVNAAKHWALWEGRCATLRPNTNVVDNFSNIHLALSLAHIETHYFIHHGFIAENQILDNMSSLQQIPSTIVHGRYDMICPLDNAFALKGKWPQAQLRIIRDAGHSARDPSILDALIRASDEMAEVLDTGC